MTTSPFGPSESFYQHVQESLANAKVSARQPCWSKTDFDVKLAFKVIHFAINYRQTRCSIWLCNIAGLISDVSEEVATQIVKKLPSSTTPLLFDAPPRGTPRISAYALYFWKLESLGYIFGADSMGLSSFKFEQWAPKDASFLRHSAFWPFKVIQGHPRSSIFLPIESAYMTSVSHY